MSPFFMFSDAKGRYSREYGNHSRASFIGCRWAHTTKTHSMILSPIQQALKNWRPTHLFAQINTWTMNLSIGVNPSRHNTSPLTPPLGSFIWSLTPLYLTSRHLHVPSFTSMCATLYTPSISPSLGSHFGTLSAASDHGNKTWRETNFINMTPWEYYPFNLGNVSSTKISRGHDSSLCVHSKMGKHNRPPNLAHMMEHIKRGMVHYLGIFHNPKKRENSTPPPIADIGSCIIQTGSEINLSKMRRNTGSQCTISVEEHEELVNTVKNLQIQLISLSTQVLTIT
jgi:hypothetical protein